MQERNKILGDAVVEAARILNENIVRAADAGLMVEIETAEYGSVSNPFTSPILTAKVYEPIA